MSRGLKQINHSINEATELMTTTDPKNELRSAYYEPGNDNISSFDMRKISNGKLCRRL